MDVIKRIDHLMKERNWSDYKLSIESGLSASTIANIHRRNTIPSIPTLESICSAFGITLAQFFDEDADTVYLNKQQQDFFNIWFTLTDKQKNLLYYLVKEFKQLLNVLKQAGTNFHLLSITFSSLFLRLT